MTALTDYIQGSLDQLHSWWDDALSGLTPGQMAFRPGEGGNHIGFIAWHVVRTEDNVVQFVLQDRKPTVWLQGGYDEKFGLHRTAQGTGMAPEDARALQLPPVEEWMPYQRAVWQATTAWLAGQSDADLQRTVRVNPFGDIPLLTAMRQIVVNHGFLHLGEAHHLRALQGLKTTPF